MDCRRYAYAVASVREEENTLLSASFFEQLLQTPTYDASCSLVRDKGIDENALDKIVSDAWEYLCETVTSHPAVPSEVLIWADTFLLPPKLHTAAGNHPPDSRCS